MDEIKERILKNSLLVNELLQNKEISNTAWKEWTKSSKVLPKTGKKQFEPNGSLLQNLQIEKDIKNRQDLLSIERVDRQSHIAIAEWLPDQKKACVIKKSGQSWENFGHEIKCVLLLLPEEALLLLEMSCLELKWNGLSLSLQQAYELLLDDSTCSLEEYRVYSQLVRCGFRIQRFIYSEPEKNSTRLDEPQKRKIIVDPANGLKRDFNKVQPSTEISESNIINTVQTTGANIQKPIEHNFINVNTDKNYLNEKAGTTDITNMTLGKKTSSDSNVTSSSKVEIISDETLIDGIKIVKEPTSVNIPSQFDSTFQKIDEPTCSVTFSNSVNKNSLCEDIDNRPDAKRKMLSSDDNLNSKKLKQEVIELSDEEIEEVPRPMTRIEMLNLLPDIAKKEIITIKIPKKYIPSTIKLQKNIYQYERSKLLNAQRKDRNSSLNSNTTNNNFNGRQSQQNILLPFHNQNQHRYSHNTNVYHIERREFMGINSIFNNRLPFGFHQNFYMHQRIFQQHIFQNMLNYVTYRNFQSIFHHNRGLSIQMNNFSNTSIIQRNCSVGAPFQQNVFQNLSLHQRFLQHGTIFNTYSNCSTSRNLSSFTRQQNLNRGPFIDYNNTKSTADPKEETSKPSFARYPKVSSWEELEKRWCEEKTISIDDDENTTTDSNEIEVIHCSTNPLIGPKNVRNLTEVYNKLRIIKSAPDKTVRKKRSSYKISYNVFSSTKHYRKSNPGKPMCRIVVLRKSDNLVIQPIELSRLQQDAAGVPIILAYVRTSISYIQPGIVSLPDLTKEF